jgi:hypothetical protein
MGKATGSRRIVRLAIPKHWLRTPVSPAQPSWPPEALARGMPAQVYEAGLQQRTVVIEFDTVEQARAA